MAGSKRTHAPGIAHKIESLLDNLPEKPKAERPLTTNELVTEIRAKIRLAATKGYTADELVEIFKQAGAQVSISTIKKALKSTAASPRKVKTTTTTTDSNGG